MRRLTPFFIILSCILGSCLNNIHHPTHKGLDVNIDDLISKMTLEEKIDFIGGYKGYNIRGYKHLGIPELYFADGPVGIRNFGKATAFPAGINLAASWDRALTRKIGKAIGGEARSKNIHIMLGPAMNIYRLPLCGRNFEYLGEDPFLAGQLAKVYTIGMQAEGMIANAKHYVANNQEFNRHLCSSDMNERTLHEIYLPAFKTVVQEGNIASVMTSYNLINGIHASEHHYLVNEILKEQWGFQGFVVSDWVSTYDGLACAKGGLDLEMPSGKMMSKETLIPVIQSGELHESVIDDKVRRILSVYKRFGLFENPGRSKGYQFDPVFARSTALEAARGGMVLLKNEGNILPLQKNIKRTIAIIGPNGHPAVTGGGGSSTVDPLYSTSLVDAVKNIAGNDTEIIYQKGVYTGIEFPSGIFDNFDFYVYLEDKKVPGINAEYFQGQHLKGDIIYSEFYRNLALVNEEMWSPVEIPETNFSARFQSFFTPTETGLYCIGISGDDGYRVIIDGKTVIELWRDQGDTRAKYEGFFNAGQEYNIVVEYYQNGGDARLRLGAEKISIDVQPDQYPSLALEAAKNADIVFMSVGFNPGTECEGFDRSFEMPYNQSELIKKIADVNENVIVILNAGGNVEMESWIDKVKGLLMAWYPGQEGNLAAAEILFGDINPSGKLPVSFEKRIEDNPTYPYYFDNDNDLRVWYGEGIFLGYRYWDGVESNPRYPFGFGLSYTEFSYSDLTTNKDIYLAKDSVIVKMKVKNTGEVDGHEIVQLYVSDNSCSYPRPVKELKAFDKVYLTARDEKELVFSLQKDAFSFYNPDSHAWELEPGEFDIIIGSSSKDIRLVKTIHFQ